MHSAEFRRCLETLDTAGIRRLWAHVSPHLPQPKTDDDALIAIHHARTQASSISLKLRAWSHRWLEERGFPSGLPDEIRPSAERLYPKIADAVGICVRSATPELKPVADAVQGAMSDAVMGAYAEGQTDPQFVRTRMQEARERTVRQLVGLGRLAARART